MSDAVFGALIGGVAAALLAGLGFWITYKTSTEAAARAMRLQAASKKAEFRQQWIENLRRAVASYCAQGSSLIHAQTGMISQEKYQQIVETTEYIELLLNHAEVEASQLISAMRNAMDEATKPRGENPGAFYKARKEVNSCARVILKTEWEKIKLELQEAQKQK